MTAASEPAHYVQREHFQLVSFERAFYEPWEYDAHFVTYYVSNIPDGFPGAFPRLKKKTHLVESLAAEGCPVMSWGMALDYDLPEHRSWEQGEREQFLEAVQGAASSDPAVAAVSMLYFTRGGARAVYALKEHLPVGAEWEALHRGLVRVWATHGIRCDRLSDWTRYFRLPRVMRDGQMSDTAIIPPSPTQIPTTFDPRVLVPADYVREPERALKITEWDQPPPQLSEIHEIHHPTRSTGPVPTALRVLPKSHDLYGIFVKGHKLACIPGQRYNTLMGYVAAASRFLTPEGLTPPALYALFHYPLLAPDWQVPDDDGTAWQDHVWRWCCEFWAKDDAKLRAEEQDAMEVERKSLDLAQEMIQGMSAWHPGAKGLVGNEAKLFVRKHLLAPHASGKSYYVLGRDGCYEPMALASSLIPNAFERRGYGAFVGLRTDNGSMRNGQHFINECATPVSRIIYEAGHSGGGWIENPGTAEAALRVPCYYLRTDLEPTFDQDVDSWLRAIGGDRYQTLCEWLGHALAFAYGPLPLLCLIGPPDSGKGMLANGLAECLNLPGTANADDLFSDYQDGLLRSPFIVIDEGAPQDTRGKHPADRLRELIGTRKHQVNQKYVARVEVETNVRVLLTANSEAIMEQFVAGRHLDEYTRRAIAERVICIKIPSAGSAYLKQQGNYAHTGQPGRRWLMGQGGEASDYVLAKHLLWIYRQLGYGEAQPPARQSRFLMTGDATQDVIERMRAQDATTQGVIKALAAMLRMWGEEWERAPAIRAKPDSPLRGIHFEPGLDGTPRLFILSSAITGWLDEHQQRVPNPRRMKEALANISESNEKVNAAGFSVDARGRIVLQTTLVSSRQRWKMVDLKLLHQTLLDWDIDCPIIATLVEGPAVRVLPPQAVTA